MIGYIMVGTNDLEKAQAFYTPLLQQLGMSINKDYSSEKYTWYGPQSGMPMFVVTNPNDGGKATAGNGTMVALFAESNAMVDKAHETALSLGGTDEGAPGPRSEHFYGAYFRDLDGNKICVFKIG